MIGYYGEVIFETSDKKILTFKGLKRDKASRYATHETILSKPKSEFLGPGLDTISFVIDLKANLGVKPKDELDLWEQYAENGEAQDLVIGGKPIGSGKWITKSISETWNTVFKEGQLFSATLEVTLEEYV